MKQKPLSRPGFRLLVAINRYYYLTAEQALRATGYKHLPTVQGHLLKITLEGYVERHRRMGTVGDAPGGSNEFIYHLTRKGERVIKALYGDVNELPSETPTSWLFYSHTLAANDFLIALDALARKEADVEMVQFLHERTLKKVLGKVVPDAWVELSVAGEPDCIALELDRGTEDRKKWQTKVTHLIDWAKGPYQAYFGEKPLAIAVVAQPGAKRAEELRRWTREVLEEQHLNRGTWPDFFLFTGDDPATMTPTEFFGQARWSLPFSDEPVPLLRWGVPAA